MIATRKTGWIGVDVGSSTVKVAQVARSRDRWELATATVVPRPSAWPDKWTPDSEPISSVDEISAARSLQPDYSGVRVAASLPMAMCDLHSLDRRLDNELHANEIIRRAVETATQQPCDDLEFDHWSGEFGQDPRAPACTNVLTIGRSWSDQLYDDVTQSGWSCETIDGLPLAMARAVGMVCDPSVEAPVAAVDWGFRRATFCVVVDGRPVYVRCLKDCGLSRVVDALTDGLQLTHDEALSLLEEHGLPGRDADSASEASQLVRETIAEPLGQLEAELKRSLEHFQYQRRSAPPRQMVLMGGGAAIRNLGDHLRARLRTRATVWRLDRSSGGTQSDAQSNCIFATAAALSALAWETMT